MPVAMTLHLLAVVIWVGGMFFAWMVLRPVAAVLLEPALRMPLWAGSFKRFFPWVWAAVVLLPATGYWAVFHAFGNVTGLPLYIHAMQGIGWVMVAVFLHVYFAPYRQFRIAVAAADWATAGRQLGRIRTLIGFNLLLGVVLISIVSVGRQWA